MLSITIRINWHKHQRMVFDPNSVDCKTSKRRVKEAMTAVAMGGAESGRRRLLIEM
jgi:hypothetical protein